MPKSYFMCVFFVLATILRESQLCEILLKDVSLDMNEEFVDAGKSHLAIDYDTEQPSVSGEITFLEALPSDLMFKVEIFTYSMGDYNQPLGVNIQTELCDGFREPVFIRPILLSMNVDENDCPSDKTVFALNNYLPPTDLFPDDCESNEYKVVLTMFTEDDKLLEISIYSDAESG